MNLKEVRVEWCGNFWREIRERINDVNALFIKSKILKRYENGINSQPYFFILRLSIKFHFIAVKLKKCMFDKFVI